MIGVVDRATKYFGGHPKRQQALEKAISDTQLQSTKNRLHRLCRTRWVQRLGALETSQALMSSVVACLDIICTAGPSHWSTDALTDARGLLLSITAAYFICALVITNKYVGYLRALTCSLQTEAQDVVEAVSEIDVVVSALQDVRNNIDKPHDEWYHEVEELCSALGAAPSLPRRYGRQEHRNNLPADDPSTYYRRCISVPMVDHLLSELLTRFSPHHRTATLGLSLVPSALVSASRRRKVQYHQAC